VGGIIILLQFVVIAFNIKVGEKSPIKGIREEDQQPQSAVKKDCR
jgi:hypothetical protein